MLTVCTYHCERYENIEFTSGEQGWHHRNAKDTRIRIIFPVNGIDDI
jgi:hypothetical protein